MKRTCEMSTEELQEFFKGLQDSDAMSARLGKKEPKKRKPKKRADYRSKRYLRTRLAGVAW